MNFSMCEYPGIGGYGTHIVRDTTRFHLLISTKTNKEARRLDEILLEEQCIKCMNIYLFTNIINQPFCL